MDIKSVVKFNITDANLREMKKRFLTLSINGIEDKEGYELVKSAITLINSKYKETDERRKVYKADALAMTRFVDSEAKRFLKPLEEIKEYLKGEKEKIDNELKEIEFKKLQETKLPERREKLANIGMTLPEEDLLKMNDTEFIEAVGILISDKLENEAKERQAAQDKLDAERVEFETEKKKLEDEKLAIQRQANEEKRIKEATKRAEEDLKIKLEQERLEKLEQERKELEKAKKNITYKNWLKSNEYSDENKHLFKVERDGDEFTLYKIVSKIIIN